MTQYSRRDQDQSPTAVVAETSSLPIGCELRHPLYDSDQVLLLNAGATITETIKQRLLARQIEQVVLSSVDYSAMFGAAATPAPAGPRRGSRAALSTSDPRYDAVAASVTALTRSAGVPLKNQMTPKGVQPYDRSAANRLAAQFARNTKSVELMMRKVVQGAAGDASVLTEVVHGYVGEMGQDLDHVLASSGSVADTKELVQRSLRMALVGMAVGIEMKLDEASVCELGICGVVHDWGLYCLPERLRKLNEPFSDYDWELYMRHPSLTFDALATIGNLSPAIRFAASQVHEMCDGSGYPRGFPGKTNSVHSRS